MGAEAVELLGGVSPAQLVDDWESWMMVRGMAAGTIGAYRWALDGLVAFLHRRGVEHVLDLTPRHLEQWQSELSQRWVWKRRPPYIDASAERLSTGSQMQAVYAVRSLLKYARKQRLGLNDYLPDALETVRVRRKVRREIPRPDFERLVAYLYPRRPHMGAAELRTRALFFYLFYSGARVSEVLQLTRAEVERAIIWQKGGTEKVLVIPLDAVQFVADYLAAREDDCPWLWVNHEHSDVPMHRLSADGVRDIWRRLCKRLGVPYFTTHQIRHSTATYMRRVGVDDAVGRLQLGHHDARTYELYRQIDTEEREEAVGELQAMVRAIAGSTPRPRLLKRLKRRPGGR